MKNSFSYRRWVCGPVLLAAAAVLPLQAQFTQGFGTGANAFTMDFVTIGNLSNIADNTGYGAVTTTFRMGKHEVSRDVIAKASSAGSLGITMADMTGYGGDGVNRPATGVSWIEAAAFVNWLNTSTGHEAAYKLSGGVFSLWTASDPGYDAANPYRNSEALFSTKRERVVQGGVLRRDAGSVLRLSDGERHGADGCGERDDGRHSGVHQPMVARSGGHRECGRGESVRYDGTGRQRVGVE